MPGFEPHAGSPDVERDARGDHDLLFGADEEGEILRTLAPGLGSFPHVEVQDPLRRRTANSCP